SGNFRRRSRPSRFTRIAASRWLPRSDETCSAARDLTSRAPKHIPMMAVFFLLIVGMKPENSDLRKAHQPCSAQCSAEGVNEGTVADAKFHLRRLVGCMDEGCWAAVGAGGPPSSMH